MLCHRALDQPDLNDLVNEYLGTLGPSMCHRSIIQNVNDENSSDDDDNEIEFVGASFQPYIANSSEIWSSPVQRASALPPYNLIYNVEIFCRYCDECNEMLDEPKVFPHDFVTLDSDNRFILGPAAEKTRAEVAEETSTPGQDSIIPGQHSTVTPDQDSIIDPTVKDEMDETHRRIDRAITNVVLCTQCAEKFIQRESVGPVIAQINRAAPILSHCLFLKEAVLPNFDHGMNGV